MDQARAAQADRSAAALMLASSIADAYFGWQSDQNRLWLAKEKENSVESQARVSAARGSPDLDSEHGLNNADLPLAAAPQTCAEPAGSVHFRAIPPATAAA